MTNGFRVFLMFMLFLAGSMTIWAADSNPTFVTPAHEGSILKSFQVSKTTFNPSVGQKIELQYELIQDAKVTIEVYDPDQERVVTLLDQELQKTGKNSVTWDGKDMDGKVVPDEAYFFTVEAESLTGQRELYDPTVFSGGKEQDLTEADLDRDTGAITYRLPETSRVRIRLGISSGPLLNTLVDWKPRPAGQVTGYWDGKDRDDLIDLINHPRFKMIISYFDLPDNSVIAFGNNERTYLEYKKNVERTEKDVFPRIDQEETKVSRHYDLSRAQAESPDLVMTFPQADNPDGTDIPVLNGKTLVHVELDDESKRYFQNTKFEIVFFLDGEFYAEEEVGYSPYNWVWNTVQVNEGTYILTVNLSGFGDQVGVLSRKVKIVH